MAPRNTLRVGKSSATVRVIRRVTLATTYGTGSTLCLLETIWDRQDGPTYAVAARTEIGGMEYWTREGQYLGAYRWAGMEMRRMLEWTHDRAAAEAEFARRTNSRA